MPSQEVLDYQQYVKETGQKDPEFEQYLKETGQQIEPARQQPLSQFPAMQHGLDAATARIKDTVQMSKPDMQGPPMPPTMPAEEAASQQALGMAAGQMPVPAKAAPVAKIDPFTKKPIGSVPAPQAQESMASHIPSIAADIGTLLLGHKAHAAKRLIKVGSKVMKQAGATGKQVGLEGLLLGAQAKEEAGSEE